LTAAKISLPARQGSKLESVSHYLSFVIQEN
jgi:hypothetical protein